MKVLERTREIILEESCEKPGNGVLGKLSFCFLIFMVGCLIGWIYEGIFYFVTEGLIEKRGFLYGPYLPVYGFGSVLMLEVLRPLKKYPVLVFVCSALLTGVLEYITGFGMWQIWQRRWWDYTGLFWNIDGFVCLRSILTFAVGGLMLLYLFEPFMKRLYHKMGEKRADTLSGILFFILITDCIMSFLFRNPIE